MDSKEVIKYKIEILINTLLEKGIQPEELVSNIWRNQYSSFNIFKEDEHRVVCSIYFNDNGISINMIYKYDENKDLIIIEETVEGRKTILWDRKEYIRISINDICDLIRATNNIENATSFIKSLPKYIKVLIQNELAEIA